MSAPAHRRGRSALPPPLHRAGTVLLSCLLVVTSLGESMYLLRALPTLIMARTQEESGREEREERDSEESDGSNLPLESLRRVARDRLQPTRTRTSLLPPRQALFRSSGVGPGLAVGPHVKHNGTGTPLRC